MQRTGTCVACVLLLTLLCASPALGVTVLVNVYEHEENITPLQGASLFANGARVGKTDSSGNIEFSHPGTGIIQVMVEKPGYDPWSGDIGVNTTTLLVEMQRKKVPLLVQVFDADTLAPVAGATVSVIERVTRQTARTEENGTGSFSVTGDSMYTLEVTAPDYRAYSATVETGLEAKTVQALLFRDDRFSVLVRDESSGNPVPGVAILVDGEARGITDQKGAVTLNLPRGKVYSFQAKLEGYEDYRERIIVDQDQALVVLTLKKSPYSVFVSVYSEEKTPVEGALVLLDGQSRGTTNKYGRVQLADLTLGEYLLEVRHPAFVSHSQVLPVRTQGEDVAVELEYPGVNATISTMEEDKVAVPGVVIRIDGKEQGVTGEDGTLSLRMRLNTSYVITTEKEGYDPAEIKKTFASLNETALLLIPMQKSFNWLGVGVLIAVAAALSIAAFVVLKKRRPGNLRRRGKGL